MARKQKKNEKRQSLRIHNPGLVMEPQHRSICHSKYSSGIVVSKFSTHRLMGAFEVIKQIPCKTSIVTVGTCKALKAQLAIFLHHIYSCPVLRTRIIEQARLQRIFVNNRKRQYLSFKANNDTVIRDMGHFALHNRSYMLNPRKFVLFCFIPHKYIYNIISK